MTIPLVTIDGPSGTGKSTLTYALTQRTGWHFLNSGGLYRLLAYQAKKGGIDTSNESQLVILAAHLDARFHLSHTYPADSNTPIHFILEGKDVTADIILPSCAATASQLATMPKIRKALLGKQRAFWVQPGLIAEGRDMGTVVFPEAPLKIFLDASPDIRAKRRAKQLKKISTNVSLSDISKEIAQRDTRDKTRKVAPLKPAEDAVIIDTTALDLQQVLACVLKEITHLWALPLQQ